MTLINFNFLGIALVLCIFSGHGEGNPHFAFLDDDEDDFLEEIKNKEERLATISDSEEAPRYISAYIQTGLPDEDIAKITEVSNPSRIFSRKEWKATEINIKHGVRPHPAEYVMISDAGERCFSPEYCAEMMQKIQKNTPEKERGQLSSFYIGDDGNSYEGKGWHTDGSKLQGGLENFSLWVTFLGKFQEELPSQKAVVGFKSLVNHAISSGKLSPNYKLISHRLIYNGDFILGLQMDNELKSWDHYTDQVDLYPGQKYRTAGLFPIVFREEWNSRGQNKMYDTMPGPIEYVVVMNGLFRCFSTEACVIEMQNEEELAFDNLGYIRYNFYIGDDGLAYEGRGWDHVPFDPLRYPGHNYAVVSFIGTYNTYLPSERALLAFKKLLRFGVWLNKISPSYKLLSIKKYDDFFIGDMLHEEIKKMDRFTEDV